VWSGATDVHYRAENRGVIIYDLPEPYPATSFIEGLKSKLEKLGWRPLSEDFLNPGLPTSLRSGWGNYEDRTRVPARTVYEWSGQWQDSSGSIVWYILTYGAHTTPEGELKTDGPLHVRATLLSPGAADQMRSSGRGRSAA